MWATAVYKWAGANNFGELQDRLGDDGKWDGMWSRYRRGLVGPSRKRIARIEEKVPGTARYFHTGFWDLLEDRPYHWQDLVDAISLLPSDLFPQLRRGHSFGRLTNSSESEALLEAAVDMVSDTSNGIHGLTVILLLLREGELVKDELLYLHALKAWARASERKRLHPILAPLSLTLFAQIARPLEQITFADQAKNSCWQQYLTAYFDYWHDGQKPRSDEFDILDCVSRFEDFKVRTKEEFERLVSKQKFDSRADNSGMPFWLLPTRISR